MSSRTSAAIAAVKDVFTWEPRSGAEGLGWTGSKAGLRLGGKGADRNGQGDGGAFGLGVFDDM